MRKLLVLVAAGLLASTVMASAQSTKQTSKTDETQAVQVKAKSSAESEEVGYEMKMAPEGTKSKSCCDSKKSANKSCCSKGKKSKTACAGHGKMNNEMKSEEN